MSLKVEGLCKTFRDKLTLKKTQVLFDVSFSVDEGRVVGFLGNNGSGKTTTMKCLLGLLKIDKGQIEFFGGRYKDPREYIGYLPERPYFYDYLTGLEFLIFYGQLSSKLSLSDIKKKALGLLEMVGIPHARDLQLRNFSKGMLQRVGLAQALIHEPKFLILDEPMSGLDPDGRYQMVQIIRDIAKTGTTIFFSSHLLDDVEKLCERLVIINRGRIIYSGMTEELLKTNRAGYEITYMKNNVIEKQLVDDISEVNAFLKQIESDQSRLIQVREPMIRLEDAFARLRQRDVQ